MDVIGIRAAVTAVRKLQCGTLYVVEVHEMTYVVLPSAECERLTTTCRFAVDFTRGCTMHQTQIPLR